MNAQAAKDTATTTIVKPPYMQNRELSWLDFNKRVLDQGADPTVPLLERLNFISIFWSNLQEFFMVRVGSLTDLSLLKKSIIDPKSGMTPAQQLEAIYARCHELYPYYEETYESVRALLAEQDIRNLRKEELTDEQLDYLRGYMQDNVLPFLSPQIINARHPFPHLENGGLYIVVRLDEEAAPKAKKSKEERAREKAEGKAKATKNLGAEGVTLGIIPLPRQTSRVIELPGSGLPFMLVEHAIEMFAAEVFSMYTVKHTNVICVTRNADLDATEGAEEQGEDYREHMKRILKKRSRLAPVRLESERPLSRTVKGLLLEKLGLAEHQLFVTRVPLNMGYTWGLGSRLGAEKRATLTQAPFTPQWPACLDRKRSIIEQVSEHEVLLSYPYQSMDAFVQLLREASVDPAVVSIKITLYRLASQSHLAEALINAAENGKEVTALFELRARFDESNNIEWSQRFEAAGCHVIYGFRNFKVHSKICTITRQTENGLQHITQLGTGNYNEKTAKLYTDFSFITCDSQIGHDAADFFRNMALENTSDNYDILWVAPLMIKQNILRNIDVQIERARRGEKCGLFFKTNSITDKEVIDKLVEASQAGVPIDLFVRGISCILPGVEGYTDRVREVSIVGQLLERLEIQSRRRVRNFPFLMGQGVWLDSEKLGPDDEVREVLKHGTLSIGFIGLAECLKALTGAHHGESAEAQALGLEIIGRIRDRADRESAARGLNFSCLATPAEGLSGRFVRMDAKRFGVIPGVTDREYYTNSFHVPVYYPISAFNKLRIEAPYHALTNGGHISYIEMDGDPLQNLPAFEKVVRFMGQCGIGYGSINHPVDRDPVCGFNGIIGDTCPRCGRRETPDQPFERIRRITGYLVGTLDRFNNGKRAEERDRVKHGVTD